MSQPWQPGAMVGERYEIVRELGSGGMATVYLARDTKHDRQVAIKALEPDLSSSIATERFLREIQLSAKLHHPRILPMLDSGQSGGSLFYVMPYVPGETLGERLGREGALPIEDAVGIIRQVAEGLDHAHAQGIVHRDIKPDNILLHEDNAVLADFGIARAVSQAGGEKLTRTGVAVGTPLYMSPEQGEGSDRVDERSDIYSLACVLYETLAGAPPFTGPTPQVLRARHALDDPPPIRTARPKVPEYLADAVEKALAKLPADRFARAHEFAEAISGTAGVGGLVQRPRRLLTGRRVGFALAGALAVWGLVTVGAPLIESGDARLDPQLIAVLPFHAVGEGLDLYREGMVDLMAPAIHGTGDFKASDPRSVLKRWRVLAEDTAALIDPELAATLGADLGASLVVLGSVVRSPSGGLLASADLYSVDDGAREASALIEADEEEVTELVDGLTVQLLQPVWKGKTELSSNLAAATTSSLPAWRAYLRGERALRESSFGAAGDFFAQALRSDSTFSMALVRYCMTLSQVSRFGNPLPPEVVELVSRSIGSVSQLDSAFVEAMLLHTQGDIEAVSMLQSLAVGNPDYMEMQYMLGEAYYHQGMQAGYPPEIAIPVFERAVDMGGELAPAHLVDLAYYAGDTASARRWSELYLGLESNTPRSEEIRVTKEIVLDGMRGASLDESSLDTLSAEAIQRAVDGIHHNVRGAGESWPIYERLTTYLIDREGPAKTPFEHLWLGIEYIRHGQPIRGLELLRQHLAYRPEQARGLNWLMAGLRSVELVPDSVSEPLYRRLLDNVEEGEALGFVYGGIGLSEEAPEVLLELSRRWKEEGNHRRANLHAGQVWAAKGRNAAARDSIELAIVYLRRSMSETLAWSHWSHGPQKYLIAELVRDRGGVYEAIRYYGSLQDTPWLEGLGYMKAAELHEQLGNIDDARDYYRRFTDLWQNAEPHLQPLVESAERALGRLSAERPL